jgi:PAS domain S-box-containing protein
VVAQEARLGRLFTSAFTQSQNAMALLDSERCHVDANGAYIKLLGYRREELIGRPFYDLVLGGPLGSREQWARALAAGAFHGEAPLRSAEGGTIEVQWAATVEVITGDRLVLFVALSTSRWGGRFRRASLDQEESVPLSDREREIVRLVALGRSGPEIADELRITHNTVRTHVRNAMIKSDTRSRAHLVAKALGDGFIFD